jgi:hypothetical protein
MNKTVATTLGALTLAVLGACGGGGGGGGGSGGGVVTGPPLAVSASNYQTVAVESASVVNDMVDSSALTTSLVGVRSSTVASIVPTILRGLPDWIAQAAVSHPVLVGVLQTSDVPCSAGSMTLSFNDVNNNLDFDSGEAIGVTFHNCSNAGTTLAGSMTIVANSQPAVLGASVLSLDVTVTMNQLDMVDTTSHLHANGAMRVAVSRTAPGSGTGFDTISTAAFTESNTVGGVTSTRTLQDFTARIDLLAGQATTTYSGTLTSSALGGSSVTFGSTTPFVTLPNGLYPSSGVSRAVGANGSKAILTVIDATTVRIDLDANGDGTPETSTTRLWTSLF